MCKKFIAYCLCITFCFSSLLFAKEVNLYDAPKQDAKVTGKIDLSAGVIPIYTPKEGDWIKVADPRNGNVGWLKSSEMSNAGTPTSITFTQRIINDGKGGAPHTYQFLQYGNQEEKLTAEQVQQLKQMRERQQALQQSIQKVINEMMIELNNLYRQGITTYGRFMPIVIMPEQQNQPAAATQKSGEQPKPATPTKPVVKTGTQQK